MYQVILAQICWVLTVANQVHYRHQYQNKENEFKLLKGANTWDLCGHNMTEVKKAEFVQDYKVIPDNQ